MHVRESWTLTAELERRIQALEMRCYRRLLKIIYKLYLTNEEVRNKIQDAIGKHDDLFSIVKKRKLRWYGHISRASGMVKTISQGTVKGTRGRQRKTWEDNIKDWIGLEFGESVRAGAYNCMPLVRVVEDLVGRRRNVETRHLWCPNDHQG